MQKFCEKVEVANSEEMGWHLKAVLDIEPGEVILEEKPLLVTPHWDCDRMKCSNCYKDSFIMCKKCQVFPLCMDCRNHDEFECNFFAITAANISKHFLVKNYSICAILKLLLLLENPNTVTDLKKNLLATEMKKLSETIRETETWQEHDTQIVRPIMEANFLNCLQRFHELKIDLGFIGDEDFIHSLCFFIDGNAFEVTTKSDNDSLKAIFTYGAKIPHSCMPNTAIAFDYDFNMKIYATIEIPSGDLIYNSYVNPLMGTSQRQLQLKLSRHIFCNCARCSDPTELGTHISSLKCQQCTDGFITINIKSNENWICNACENITDNETVNQLLADVTDEMMTANGDLEAYEQLLDKFSAHFHPNHFLIIDIKQNIASILTGILMNPYLKASKSILERKVQICEDVLPILRSVVPGLSKLYAIALYDYLLPFLELAEQEFRSKNITRDEYIIALESAEQIATQITSILSYEPANSSEGTLVQRIAIEKKQIDENLSKLKSVCDDVKERK